MSVTTAGAEGDWFSHTPALSRDGRFVSFRSFSVLVPGDNNGFSDIYLHDRQDRSTVLISLDNSGQALTGYNSDLSDDGQKVAFMSLGNSPDGQIHLRDRIAAATTLISQNLAGLPANNHSYLPDLSGAGNCVAFQSFATDLIASDTNAVLDVFVHDLVAGQVSRVSESVAGVEADDASSFPRLSGDGQLVVFTSRATNLIPGDNNGRDDIFLRDCTAGTLEIVSVDSAGNPADGASLNADLSEDGRYVVYESYATNLAPADTNLIPDIFLRDRTLGTTQLLSLDLNGQSAGGIRPRISATGRFVTFASDSSNLVLNDTNAIHDLFQLDRDPDGNGIFDEGNASLRRISVDTFGAQGNDASASFAPISEDGHWTAFSSLATNLVRNDSNEFSDVFVHGPPLTLEADQQNPPVGSTVQLQIWRGSLGSPVLLFLESISGTRVLTPLFAGFFPAQRIFMTSGTPGPAASGLDFTLRGFALNGPGRVIASNPLTLRVP